MSDQRWDQIDAYVTGLLLPKDQSLDDALAASRSLPNIQVSAPQGKLLAILARAVNARRALEVGTLGGYSAIWIARALGDDGTLVTLEVNEEHAGVARGNIEHAGLAGVVEVRVGPALDTLAAMQNEGVEPFDFVFIDADKPPTADYFDFAVRLSHPGSLIVVDNVVREGKVLDAESDDPAVRGMRRFMQELGNDSRVTATVIQTVGVKGFDGFAVALVR